MGKKSKVQKSKRKRALGKVRARAYGQESGPQLNRALADVANTTMPTPQVLPVTISLCMIVKDEEKRLPDSLRSSLPLVDEVIVVDTGSTDKTMDILRTAQKEWRTILKRKGQFTILEKAWNNDFSEMRNYGLSFATGDWILQLDADECIDQQTSHLLRQAAVRAEHGDLKGHGAFFFHLYNVLADGKKTFILHPHLFRRIGLATGAKFHFRNRVHNQPVWEGNVCECPMAILHYGYGEDAPTMLKKHLRRKQQILKWLEDEPNGFWPHFYAGQTLSAEADPGVIEQVIQHCKRAIEIKITDPTLVLPEGSEARCYYSWMITLMRHKMATEVVPVAEEALSALPWYPDSWFFLAWAHMHQGRWKECCRACLEFFNSQEQAKVNDDIRRKFIGVENLTIDAAPTIMGFWRTAAAHCHGCAGDAKIPVVNIAGVDTDPSNPCGAACEPEEYVPTPCVDRDRCCDPAAVNG